MDPALAKKPTDVVHGGDRAYPALAQIHALLANRIAPLDLAPPRGGGVFHRTFRAA